MKLDKNDLHFLKYLRFYKFLTIICIAFGSVGIPYGLYFSFFHVKSHVEGVLNNALISASVVVVAMGYIMYCFVKIIEKLKNGVHI